MNGKMAKVCRRFSLATGTRRRDVKRRLSLLSHDEKHAARREMWAEVRAVMNKAASR